MRVPQMPALPSLVAGPQGLASSAAARLLEPEQRSPRPGRLPCSVSSARSRRTLPRPWEGPASASAGSMALCWLTWNPALSSVPAIWCPPFADLPQGDSQEGLSWEHRRRPRGAEGPGPCRPGARGTFGTSAVLGVRREEGPCAAGDRVLTMWLGTAALMTSCYLDAFFWRRGWHSRGPPVPRHTRHAGGFAGSWLGKPWADDSLHSVLRNSPCLSSEEVYVGDTILY